ncbi:MAG: hypothetical protein ACE5PV_09555 [Candidatus Poribacteria bacterium]
MDAPSLYNFSNILTVPEEVISTYSLEQHVWRCKTTEELLLAKQQRQFEEKTLEDFIIDPVRHFLYDFFEKVSAPHKPNQATDPIGQGYWVQAEFGSGKTHLLSFITILALAGEEQWRIIEAKEKEAGRGKRDSLFHLFSERMMAKQSDGRRGIFPIVITLVGAGGTSGDVEIRGKKLHDYIFEEAQRQFRLETEKILPLYPTELLAKRFLERDVKLYADELKEFLEYQVEGYTYETFLEGLSANSRQAGGVLWQFYQDALEVNPQIPADKKDIFEHLTECLLDEGYQGMLVVLDEVSEFRKRHSDKDQADIEDTLLILAHHLPRVKNLPVWLVCAAQQKLEEQSSKKILAPERLKLVELLKREDDYYQIVVNRVRTVKGETWIKPYYDRYSRLFPWPAEVGEDKFNFFFPFYPDAINVIRAISFQLTTTRSAIHFLHSALKSALQQGKNDLLTLWNVFEEVVNYTEDPSGTSAGVAAVKSRFSNEYRAYEQALKKLEAVPAGALKVYRERAKRILKTLFLYKLADIREGLDAVDVLNAVMDTRKEDATKEENIEHYNLLLEEMANTLRQVKQKGDLFSFEPAAEGIDPEELFQQKREEIKNSDVAFFRMWETLFSFDGLEVKTPSGTHDYGFGQSSFLAQVLKEKSLSLLWHNRGVRGKVLSFDPTDKNIRLPEINTPDTDEDFMLVIAKRPVDLTKRYIEKLAQNDPRILFWSPADFSATERELVIDFGAYVALIRDYEGKSSEEARTALEWVYVQLEKSLPGCLKVVDAVYERGSLATLEKSAIHFTLRGGISGTMTPAVSEILDAVYQSKEIDFTREFKKDDYLKLAEGLIQHGRVLADAPQRFKSAAENFAKALFIAEEKAPYRLATAENRYIRALWEFVKENPTGDRLPIASIYKNFMGIPYGLSRGMVQLFLLALVRDGRIKLHLRGTQPGILDFSNIADVKLTNSIISSFHQIEVIKEVSGWKGLRPFVEILLERELPETSTPKQIESDAKELLTFYRTEKKAIRNFKEQVENFFLERQGQNPLDELFGYFEKLFARDFDEQITVEESFELIETDLASVLGKRLDEVKNEDMQDFREKWGQYLSLKRVFVQHRDAVTAMLNYTILAKTEFSHSEFSDLSEKLQQLQAYMKDMKQLLTDEVFLEGTVLPHFNSIKDEYFDAYHRLHDEVETQKAAEAEALQTVLASSEMKALALLDDIESLGKPVTAQLAAQINETLENCKACSVQSEAELKKTLSRSPICICGLQFDHIGTDNPAEYDIEGMAEDFQEQVHAFLLDKARPLLQPVVRERLERGKDDERIAKLLSAPTEAEIAEGLVESLLADASFKELISQLLSAVQVREVRLVQFKPTKTTISRKDLDIIVAEFREFLSSQLKDEGTLLKLQ